MAYDEETARRLRGLLRRFADISERKMMGGLAFMTGEAMFCSVSGRGGLLVRVEPSSLEAALREAGAERADMAGRTMAGFVRVRPDAIATDEALRGWVERGLAAAAALDKPKATAGKRRVR